MAFRIYFSVDIARALQDLQQLRLDDKITDMAKTVRVSLHDAAERSARQHIGGTFGDDLARGVRSQIDGNVVTVDHKSNDNTHIAEHVHSGGVIRPRNRIGMRGVKLRRLFYGIYGVLRMCTEIFHPPTAAFPSVPIRTHPYCPDCTSDGGPHTRQRLSSFIFHLSSFISQFIIAA